MSFVPDDFEMPRGLVCAQFWLEPLRSAWPFATVRYAARRP
jgi:hypothetical protein